MKLKTKPDYWDKSKKYLASKDRVLKSVINNVSDEKFLQRTCSPFQTLSNAIIGQQISIAAAESITRRVRSTCGLINKKNILTSSSAQLKKTGLSGQKVKYLKGLANHLDENSNFFSSIEKMSDNDAIKSLCKLYGVGIWTAEMYLIFQLLRPNIFPLGDVGLVNSMNTVYKIENSSTEKLLKISKKWEPFRTVAVWYIWRVIDDDIVEY